MSSNGKMTGMEIRLIERKQNGRKIMHYVMKFEPKRRNHTRKKIQSTRKKNLHERRLNLLECTIDVLIPWKNPVTYTLFTFLISHAHKFFYE